MQEGRRKGPNTFVISFQCGGNSWRLSAPAAVTTFNKAAGRFGLGTEIIREPWGCLQEQPLSQDR